MASVSAAVSGASTVSQASGPRAGPLSAPGLDRGRASSLTWNKAGVLGVTSVRDLSLRSARAEAPRASNLLVARAAVATETKTVNETFTLSDGTKLEVSAQGANDDGRAQVKLTVHDGPLAAANNLIAHWGARSQIESGWLLPGLQPDGTRRYKNRALQSPFTREQGQLTLTIELADPQYDAIEFTLKDEDTNEWYKFHEGNFHVDVPASTAKKDPATIVLPEKLVQVQAYLRWERNGKQSYSQDKEKVEYEKARRELQEAVAGGKSIAELERQLLGGGSQEETNGKPKDGNGVATTNGKATSNGVAAPPKVDDLARIEIPEDLCAIQSYIRWERNGKQNYSAEKQLEEYNIAKRELQQEVKNGVSLQELRKRLTGGSEATAPPPPARPPPGQASIHRTIWNADDYIRRHRTAGAVAEEASVAETAPDADEGVKPLRKAAWAVEEALQGELLYSKTFALENYSLLVMVVDVQGEMQVTIASDYPDPLVFHWGLSKSRKDGWQAPPDALCVIGLERACETDFEPGFGGDPTLQSLTVELGGLEKDYPGLPFVIRSGDKWMKDKGRDFFISLEPSTLKPEKVSDGSGTAKAILDEIADVEDEAEMSLMHRFNLGTDVLERARTQGKLGLAAVFVWFRFMASRQLVWNKNYNVKPREISAAQDRFTSLLEEIYAGEERERELVRMIMMTVGRGGEGDVGQRIRDEILVIQRHNNCEGGMMEEWHQKLHNNTSPDDVVICQALLDYIRAGFNIDVYWKTLNDNGVTRERLMSYDKAIHSEPRFVASQRDGLLRDLTHYLSTLKAVHSGADLESAAAKCMGYTQGAKADFMKSIQIHPIRGLSSRLPGLLQFCLEHVEDRYVMNLLQGLLEARQELRPSLRKGQERLKDVIFLDLALDSTARTAVERGMEHANSAQDIMYMVCLLVENVALSADDNEELVYCLKSWYKVLDLTRHQEHTSNTEWALMAKAVLDRTRLCLATKAESLSHLLQPSAEYLGQKLGVPSYALDIFTEEVIRGNSAASLSLLLNRLDPILRKAADMGSWQIISPRDAKGFVEVVPDMQEVQETVFPRPTILVSNRVKGEEEIPDGVVALITPDMPDVLSHVSVRARNSRVCFATCFDEGTLNSIRAKQGQAVKVQVANSASDLQIIDISPAEVEDDSAVSAASDSEPPPDLKINKKQFAGKFAVSASEFDPTVVGAKSRNIAGLQGKLPDWIKLPTSVALPFGSFEATINDPINKEVKREVMELDKELNKGDFSKLAAIRKLIPNLKPSPKLVSELEATMKASGMPWPGDESPERWEQAWKAITKVWASKWNERAFVSMRKVKLNFNDLCMAVLVQEIVQADYAFVIHTTNPSTGDANEIYAEVVLGLGETLVGAFSGRALSFVAKKGHTNEPKVVGFPSKEVGLFIRQSIIFRSDSNGEDLEGYAGAGLYDSVPMDEEEERIVDYSSDPLIVDPSFRHSILSKIAAAGEEIEKCLGSPQDIEGVIKNGELYVVQTRPQM